MKKQRFNSFFLVFGILCILYYLGMGIAVRFGQSLLFLWPLLGGVCLLRYFLVRRSLRTGKPLPFPRWLVIAWRAVLAVGLGVFLFAEFFICAGALEKAPAELDCLIILGSRVNGTVPSGSLWERIQAGGQYLLDNPDTLCIASGGQGDDEEISEAACIRSCLVDMGVAPERIFLEEDSVNTYTNLTGSFALLPAGTETVGIVTNDFHIFRALSTARALGGYTFYGVPAPSSVFGFLHYAMREFFAVAVGTLRGTLVFS